MKIKLFITALLLLIFNIMMAQSPLSIDDYKQIGESQYVIVYEMSYVNDTSKLDKIYHDEIILEIGSELSKSYSYKTYRYDSTYTDSNRKGAHNYPSPKSSAFPVDVVKKYKDKKMTIYQRTPSDGPIFEYEENMNLFDWKLTSEMKEILGFACIKATCDFRGRNWAAWFTMDIPLQDGPWKFNGLPGLIMRVESEKGDYVFECIKIKNEKRQILLYDYFYDKSTYEEVSAFLIECHNDFNAYNRRIDPKGGLSIAKRDEVTGKVTFRDVGPNEIVPKPYNPIEM
ncbi:MAG: GLPGLI family protein [Bacteroidales bacterium]|nr:GLPGLI family protein [Bacteroidales bacterium]